MPPTFTKSVLAPADAAGVAPELARSLDARVWVYRYAHPTEPWRLSVATHAAPGSRKLSLGGFRIAPPERTSLPDFDPDREAIDLAIGMEEKVYWSRIIRVGGPLAQRDFSRIVGGKCVLEPTADARVGQPRDFALLDFAIACLNDCEQTAGIHVTTGQDLGHGTMSDGRTQSLDYLNRGFAGSVVADTSKPTAEGNYYVLRGMLRGVGRDLAGARVAFIGCGNIGEYVLRRARADGASVIGVEISPRRRNSLADDGIEVVGADAKAEVLARPLDAVVVNAAGGSLDRYTVDQLVANDRLAVVCGSENLAMPDPADADRLRGGHKGYAPTELGGMMGYLTAVEEYLSHLEGRPFDVDQMLEPARRLQLAGEQGMRAAVSSGFALSFEDAVRKIFASPGGT